MAKIGSLLLVLFFPLFAFSQVKVQLSVDNPKVAVGDYVTVIVEVNADKNVSITPPTMPAFADLEFVDQSSQISDSVSIINGEYKFVRVNRYIYQYQSIKKGDFDIPPVQVDVDGKTYTTNGTKVTVLDPSQIGNQAQARQQMPRGRPGFGNPFDSDPMDELEDMYKKLLRRSAPQVGDMKPINENEAFAVRLELDKNRAYVGEQLTASYYIYIPEGSLLRSIDTLKFPSLNNFWKEDIEISTRLNFEPAQINGKRYNRALLASYALFPIKHGSLKVDSYKVKGGVASQSMFGMGKMYTYTKSSDEVNVNILPLPDANRPDNFTGVVGDFQVEAKLEDSKFKTGQPFTLKLKISGRGNAKVVELPPLNLPETLELFDKKEEAKFFPNGQSYKEFSLFITPKEVGTITIPGIGISYFDPSRMQYMTKASSPIDIVVEKGESYVPNNSPLADNRAAPTEIQLPSLSPSLSAGVLISEEYSLWAFLIIVSITILFFLYRLKADFKTNHYAKILQKKAKRRWAKASALAASEDYKNFSIEALNYVNFLLGEIVGQEGSVEKMQHNISLLPTSLRKDVEDDLLSTVEIMQAIAFAPEEMTKAVRNKAKIKEISKTINQVTDKLLKFKMSQSNL
ncbi:MAG: protein BatD [Bdellovibrionales bacterium]|nr:protein BatD [Bdellovibrionales bacterium]